MPPRKPTDLPSDIDLGTVLAIARAERASITGLVSVPTIDALITAADAARRALAALPTKPRTVQLTEADLEALPSGTVVIDKDGDALIKTKDGRWADKYVSDHTGTSSESVVLLAWAPLLLLYIPAPTSSDS